MQVGWRGELSVLSLNYNLGYSPRKWEIRQFTKLLYVWISLCGQVLWPKAFPAVEACCQLLWPLPAGVFLEVWPSIAKSIKAFGPEETEVPSGPEVKLLNIRKIWLGFSFGCSSFAKLWLFSVMTQQTWITTWVVWSDLMWLVVLFWRPNCKTWFCKLGNFFRS